MAEKDVPASEQDVADYDYNRRASNEIERVASASSASTSSSVHGSVLRGRTTTHTSNGGGMSRIPTQRDLERHPTELGRIATARSQHSNTVGVSMGRSNTQTRDSRRPLPPMGGGKTLPPKHDVEDYVVEFDGPDDPLHAQNWPLRKK